MSAILDEQVPEGGWPVISPTHPPVHPNISSMWWLFMNYTREQSKWYSKFDILFAKMEMLN